MDQLLAFYQAIPTEVFVAVFGGGAVSLFAQAIKKIFGLDSDKVIKFMVASVAVIAACLQALLASHAIPPTLLGAHAAAFYSAAELFYVFVYKTAKPFLIDVSHYEDRKARAAAGDLDVSKVLLTPVEPAQNTNIADF